MKISVNKCVYRTENLPEALKNKPEFKLAIEKAEAKEKSKAKVKEVEPEKQDKHVKKGVE